MAVVEDGVVQEHREEELQCRSAPVRDVSQVGLQTSVGDHRCRDPHQLVKNDDNHDL